MKPRLLLHTCCAPCLLEPLDLWSGTFEVEVFFYNPNIQPAAEYERRSQTLRKFAEANSIVVHEPGYGPEHWTDAVGRISSADTDRCKECYILRLTRAAEFAGASAFEAFATTLAVSPYQNQESIAEAGEALSERTGIPFVYRDMTDRYRSSVEQSRALGLYRQNYCGCIPSMPQSRKNTR